MYTSFRGRSISKKFDILNDSFTNWLYGDYNEEKLGQFELLHNIPVVGNYMDYLLDRRGDEEYLKRYGMDYSDVHDPRKLHQTNSGSRMYGSLMNFVSKNIDDLYD